MGKSILCTWDFTRDGKRRLDCYHEITTIFDAKMVRALEIRARMHSPYGGVGLFNVPDDWDMETLKEVMPSLTDDQCKDAYRGLKDSMVTFDPKDSNEKWRAHKDTLPLLLGYSKEVDDKIKEVLYDG